MADLYKLRSSDRTAWEGRLFHCTMALILIVVCGGLYLYEMHWMHSPGHPDLALNASWQMCLNKTIYNFIEHNEMRICSNDLHPRELINWVTLLSDEYSFVTKRAVLHWTASTLLILAWV